MTVACRFPERVEACISVDAAPINESRDKSFGEFTYSVVRLIYDRISQIKFMNQLSDEHVSKDQAVARAKEFFKGKIQFVSLLERNMD